MSNDFLRKNRHPLYLQGMMKWMLLPLVSVLSFSNVFSQRQHIPKGSLFIIGGGSRPASMMKTMIEMAALKSGDHIVVLPMSSAEPDTSCFYIERDIKKISLNKIACLNFTSTELNKQSWLDSLRNARLIFITGGDQNRFMKLVLNTAVHKVILEAYRNGAMIAGTSAGAAVMSKHMITGNELNPVKSSSAAFRKIEHNNAETAAGLGLVDSIIVDQHFIARSRYNRLFTILARYPHHTCIGIDEATAVIIRGNKASVVGNSQVVYLSSPDQLVIKEGGLINFRDVKLALYSNGDQFTVPGTNWVEIK